MLAHHGGLLLERQGSLAASPSSFAPRAVDRHRRVTPQEVALNHSIK
jgi:hypothetical protein